MNQKHIFLLPLLQLAAGLGWIGGTYAQPSLPFGQQLLIQILHYLLVVVLLLLSIRFLTDREEGRNWGRTGLLVFAFFVKAITMVWIVIHFTHFLGLVGPHTFADWFPIGVANSGSGLLLGLLLTRRDQHVTQRSVLSGSHAH